MKVLNVAGNFDPKSGEGTAESTYQMAKDLDKKGIYGSILTMNEGDLNYRAAKLSNEYLNGPFKFARP